MSASIRDRTGNVLTGCFGRYALEDVVDKRVEDGHGLVRDTGVRVNLLQYCNDR